MSTGGTAPIIGIVGLSHLGLVWAGGYASLGFPVVGFDTDAATVRSLNAGIVPVPEPGLAELFATHRTQMRFSTDPSVLRECGVIYYARDVPMDAEGRIDLTEIDALLDAAIPHLPPDVEFIFMGQVPCGFTRALGDRIRARRSGLSFHLTYCVETVSIGTAVKNFLQRDYTILGHAERGAQPPPLVAHVLEPFRCPTVNILYESAELTKAGINIGLASHLAFVNTMSELCERLGADMAEVASAITMDKRFSPQSYWRPGLGFAGGHFERDLSTLIRLSEEQGIEPRFLQALVQHSKGRHQWLVRAIERSVGDLADPVIAVWGLAYKKGTDSTHNAHCWRVIRDFGERATLRVYDPVATLAPAVPSVVVCHDMIDAAQGADCLVILTEWDEFALVDPQPLLSVMRHPVVIDCVNVVAKPTRERAGLVYVGMGRP